MTYEILASEPKPKRTQIRIQQLGLRKLIYVRRENA